MTSKTSTTTPPPHMASARATLAAATPQVRVYDGTRWAFLAWHGNVSMQHGARQHNV